MSHFLLMTAGGVVTPVDPETPPGPDGFPITSDPVLQALRPSGVRNLAVKTADPGSDMGELLDELKATQDALTETPYGATGPDHSAILFLPPGEYQGGFGTGRWASVVGTTGNPADVVIHSDTIEADGVVHPYSPVYFEGLTLKGSWNSQLDQSPKYAAHIAGSQRTTFANVIFDVTEARISSAIDSTWGNAGTVGMDGSPGTTVIFYACDFRDVAGQSRLGMNIHGGPEGTIASTIAFIDCVLPKGLGYNYAGQNASLDPRDKVYVIGGTVGGTFEMGGSVDVYTDHDNVVNGAVNVFRNQTEWPVPAEHGLRDLWFDYYYPSILDVVGTTEVRATVTDVAPMTLVSGRTYYCPIPVTSAVHLNRWGLHVRSGAGANWGWLAQPDPGVYYGSPVPGNKPEPSAFVTDAVLASGKILNSYYYSWMLYPATSVGGNRGWFHFKVPNASGVTVDGSAQIAGMYDCYYSDDNGVTLTLATMDQPFPLAHAAQVR